MEGRPNSSENNHNFHEISEERKGLKKELKKLGKNSSEAKEGLGAFEAEYKTELEEIEAKAKEFRVADFGTFGEAKKALREQKKDYEEKNSKDRAGIDYAVILETAPEIGEVQKIREGMGNLRAFRMQKMFEILNPNTPAKTKDRNEKFLLKINDEIDKKEKELQRVDGSILRQAELLEYKQNLSESGHICITPSVEKDLEAVGDRMLTGKPVFLHGPTGTGKTSLARFAATHFTGKDPEMVYCSPQTKESNVWGKTGIKPTSGGAIETVEIYGPLAKAMLEGKTVIFDEFTALPKEQMVFIKGIFGNKIGDSVPVPGNGSVIMQSGFQMIFTANLKSEKNPERQDLPPEVAREFEQNNIKINYINKEEAYDVILSRLLNKDGSLDMSYYDLNTTLPNLATVMAEIQESYTNTTDKEVARKAGVLDVAGNVHSLKKFVMTQGSVEAILSSWNIEKKMKRTDKSFAEFLDERFKTALTFEEYSKEDRILVAKILASRGFLLTLSPKELNLPDDIFAFNTIKAMRGIDAIEELKNESGEVKHLNLEEVAELDPFNKKATRMKKQAEEFLEDEVLEKDPFLADSDKRFKKIFGKQSATEIQTTYKTESITLNLERKLQEFKDFYKISSIDIPQDFEDNIKEIWENNLDAIQKAIEENGFDEVLLMPENLPLPDLHSKTTGGYKPTYEGINFTTGGSFVGAKSEKVDKPRIVLVHKTQNLKDRPELAKTLNIKGQDVNLDHILTLEDYLVFQRKYFKENGKHLDEDGWTWLATKSGSRLVFSNWDPDAGELGVYADDLGYQYTNLGARPSRSFF
ncbi:MAG: AAA family ATPase [Minisyncoccia bacterium]